ncbi:hypothetical protein ACMFMG_005372 [Clarireedia jacksonii]
MASSDSTAPSSYLPLKDKLAIITGASRGIGAAIAFDLAKRGSSVILTYNSPNSTPQITSLIEKIRALPHRPTAHGIRADLSLPSAPQTIIREILSLLDLTPSTLQISILINNAGRALGASLSSTSPESFSAIHDLNVRGTFLMTQACLPYFPSSSPSNPHPGSRIINLSSIGARAGLNDLSAYCSSKAAVEALARCWAMELGPRGITVNAISPGPVETDMMEGIPESFKEKQKAATPLGGRLGTKEDVVGVVRWLVGEESRWVTGQTISVRWVMIPFSFVVWGGFDDGLFADLNCCV